MALDFLSIVNQRVHVAMASRVKPVLTEEQAAAKRAEQAAKAAARAAKAQAARIEGAAAGAGEPGAEAGASKPKASDPARPEGHTYPAAWSSLAARNIKVAADAPIDPKRKTNIHDEYLSSINKYKTSLLSVYNTLQKNMAAAYEKLQDIMWLKEHHVGNALTKAVRHQIPKDLHEKFQEAKLDEIWNRMHSIVTKTRDSRLGRSVEEQLVVIGRALEDVGAARAAEKKAEKQIEAEKKMKREQETLQRLLAKRQAEAEAGAGSGTVAAPSAAFGIVSAPLETLEYEPPVKKVRVTSDESAAKFFDTVMDVIEYLTPEDRRIASEQILNFGGEAAALDFYRQSLASNTKAYRDPVKVVHDMALGPYSFDFVMEKSKPLYQKLASIQNYISDDFKGTVARLADYITELVRGNELMSAQLSDLENALAKGIKLDVWHEAQETQKLMDGFGKLLASPEITTRYDDAMTRAQQVLELEAMGGARRSRRSGSRSRRSRSRSRRSRAKPATRRSRSRSRSRARRPAVTRKVPQRPRSRSRSRPRKATVSRRR